MIRPLSELASRAAAGDRAAFDALHARLAPGLRRAFLERTRGNEDESDNLCQRTWLACWRALRDGKYDARRSAFSTYLYAIGTNLWLEHLRAARRAAEIAELPEFLGEPDADQARTAELIDAVRACLRGEGGGMTEEERLLLRESAEGATDRQLALRFSLAPSTINARRRAALEKLRVFLDVRGFRAERGHSGDQEQSGAAARGGRP